MCQNEPVPQKYDLLTDICMTLEKSENLPGELISRGRWKIGPSVLRSSQRNCKVKKNTNMPEHENDSMKSFMYRYEWGQGLSG